MSAEDISLALGHDPLLIALHDQSKTPDPHQVIGQFIEGSLSRAAALTTEYLASDYRQALRVLAGEVLSNRQLELRWSELCGWKGLQGEPLRLLGRLAHLGELIRIIGISDEQRLSFRHDRVRDWLLADAAGELDRKNLLVEGVMSDPYFAEVMGAVLMWGYPNPSFLQRVASLNPLALFCALRLIGQSGRSDHKSILKAINDWLETSTTYDQSSLYLRWEALAILSETDFAEVPAIVYKFPDRTRSGELARLRNGDLSGGLELCIDLDPGVTAPWRDMQIEQARFRYSRSLTKNLDDVLRKTHLSRNTKRGALRLAGHFADPSLALAIEACWNADGERRDHLSDYLWAFGECCGDNPECFLGPVCEAWAALPDEQRESLAAHEVRWAFKRWPPLTAIDYFVQRAGQEDLRWPITFMLHGIDHPKAVLFVVQELAAIKRRLEGTNSISPFVMLAKDDWRRAQRDLGRPMSKACRDPLFEIWRDETNDKHLRDQAFSLWSATKDSDDIEVLCAINPSDALAEEILWERFICGDQKAIPTMIDKLKAADSGYWWQCGRYLWSAELTTALDESLCRRGSRAKYIWYEFFEFDWILSEIVIRLPESDAERLLLKHWGHLRFSSYFVQAALYVSSPSLLEATRLVISECPDPTKLLEHLSFHFGLRAEGHPGLTREDQMRAIAPYLHLLSEFDLKALWEECNNHGWFNIRRELLDSRLALSILERISDREHAMSEFDRMMNEKHQLRIDHWIDDFLKAGISWNEILSKMGAWIAERRSIEALRVVVAAIEYRGTRKDLSMLTMYESISEEAAQLIANIKFAVRWRTIQ